VGFSLGALSRTINRPAVTIGAVVLALALGATGWPQLQLLRPFGNFYVALLQMCVLPFLLATIPLAVRSAMINEATRDVVRWLVVWLAIAIAVVGLIGVLVPSLIFHLMPLDQHTIVRIGDLVQASGQRVDIEFAIEAGATPAQSPAADGVLAIIPTNIFASLAGNESLRVLVFAVIFGAGMVRCERQSGYSLFTALRHIHDVCLRIFDWFNVLMPLGILALIAPQVALLGPDIYVVLALFSYAFVATSLLIFTAAILAVAFGLHITPGTALGSLLRPMMVGAATRNTLVCIPLAVETLTNELRVRQEPCELYIPFGFATFRFGTILYFSVATLFMGTLLGRSFGVGDVVLVAGLSTIASFATLGVTGVAALAPLATVLRPFGLSYELAVPLMVIVDPIANMMRVMLNVAVNCTIVALAARRSPATAEPAPVAAE
jgi:Na+/H+-dicarboxylate symporter